MAKFLADSLNQNELLKENQCQKIWLVWKMDF